MPMPPATNRSFSARDPELGTGIMKAFRGSLISTICPTVSWCTSIDPPPPSGIRRTAIRYSRCSLGSPQSEYCRIRPEGRWRSICAPGCHPRKVAPSGSTRVNWTTSESRATIRRSATRTALRLRAIGSKGSSLSPPRRMTTDTKWGTAIPAKRVKRSGRAEPERPGGGSPEYGLNSVASCRNGRSAIGARRWGRGEVGDRLGGAALVHRVVVTPHHPRRGAEDVAGRRDAAAPGRCAQLPNEPEVTKVR